MELMEYPALMTLLLLLEYLWLLAMVGKARITYEVPAPAVTGNEMFERHYRVQMNTVEQLLITLPALWLCALFFSPTVAGALGGAFFIGRIVYRAGYIADPARRGPGMLIGFFANLGLLGCALWGVISAMLQGT
jgi:glutathione S-transferase